LEGKGKGLFPIQKRKEETESEEKDKISFFPSRGGREKRGKKRFVPLTEGKRGKERSAKRGERILSLDHRGKKGKGKVVFFSYLLRGRKEGVKGKGELLLSHERRGGRTCPFYCERGEGKEGGLSREREKSKVPPPQG